MRAPEREQHRAETGADLERAGAVAERPVERAEGVVGELPGAQRPGAVGVKPWRQGEELLEGQQVRTTFPTFCRAWM